MPNPSVLQEWQPIGSAPKEKAGPDPSRFKEVLAWWPTIGYQLTRWQVDYERQADGEYTISGGHWCVGSDTLGCKWERQNQPTHWMPLPEPPVEGVQ